MKQFTSQNLIIEMSARELEMVKNALIHYSNYWEQRAGNTLPTAEVMRETCKKISKDYTELYLNVTDLLESLPFYN